MFNSQQISNNRLPSSHHPHQTTKTTLSLSGPHHPLCIYLFVLTERQKKNETTPTKKRKKKKNNYLFSIPIPTSSFYTPHPSDRPHTNYSMSSTPHPLAHITSDSFFYSLLPAPTLVLPSLVLFFCTLLLLCISAKPSLFLSPPTLIHRYSLFILSKCYTMSTKKTTPHKNKTCSSFIHIIYSIFIPTLSSGRFITGDRQERAQCCFCSKKGCEEK